MKKYLFCLSLFAALTAVEVFADETNKIEWGAITNNVQISISVKDGLATIRTNQPFSLLVRIRNVSTNQAISVYRWVGTQVDPGFSWVVVSPSGKDVSPIAELAAHGSGAFHHINPNQTFEYEFNLSSLCKFGEIGTYKIVFKMNTSESPHKLCWVVSDPLYLTVVQGEWKPATTNAPPVGF
jgi:hypothetical protein